MVKQVLATAVLVLACLSLAQAAKVGVKAVKVEQEGQNLVLKVDLSGRLEPKIFSLDEKSGQPKVVIDFPGATAQRLPASLTSPSPLARGIRIGRHPEKIRLVIDLEPGRVYRVEQYFRRDINRYILVLAAQTAP